MADLGSVGRSGISSKTSLLPWTLSGAAFAQGPLANRLNGVIIQGTVRDDNGYVCVRTVRGYERPSGKFIGEVLSGANGVYQLRTFRKVEHDVVFLDDAAGINYTDLILRVAPAP